MIGATSVRIDRAYPNALLVWSDGRVERHGFERRYTPGGDLTSEDYFEHDVRRGVSRTCSAPGGAFGTTA